MAETCIVCLGDLRVTAADEQPQPTHTPIDDAKPSTLAPTPAIKSEDDVKPESLDFSEDDTIAHLLPCGHNLHDQCLKPWVERANSCPICRANFNMVELRAFLDGPTTSSYPVQDKQQAAELDPSVLNEEDYVEEEREPCGLCGRVDEFMEMHYCDGCDFACHVFCANLDECPDVWYCNNCMQDIDNDRPLGTTNGVTRPSARPRHARRVRGARAGNSAWARVWQSVWDRLNLDLDFPYDEDTPSAPRPDARQLDPWQRRLHVANSQGGQHRFRDTAPAILRHVPESQEELRAWNAFDKAREIHDVARPTNRRKRKATTTSPDSPKETEGSSERKLKRPRTRRNHLAVDPNVQVVQPIQAAQAIQAESSNQAVPRTAGGPATFLTSLLQEVERQPAPAPAESASSDGDLTDGQQSPPLSSPVLSPQSSNHASNYPSPRGGSVTPPPLTLPRPSSPTPLTSIVRPLSTPVSIRVPFSPFSPAESGPGSGRNGHRSHEQAPSSPSRHLSYSTKREIQRMVKAALGSRYRDKELTKDEYTDINRDVSRSLYDTVGDADGLAEEAGRERLQQLANEDVERAIRALRPSG